MRAFFLLLLTFLVLDAHSKVVLIDPGHGGEEVGAVGFLDPKKSRRLHEKDLALRLSKKIKDHLSKDVSSYLTRSLDRTVSLQERADLADLVKADLFLSIHFNSSTNRKSNGFELYYLDNNSNVGSHKIEKAENLNLKGEELIINQIIVDLVVQQTVAHSRELAKVVHEHVKPILKEHRIQDRGVKRGLFYVLALSKRPGLLVEVGFVSNENELKKMNQDKFLSDMARAISAGVIAHIKSGK
jgi:N-acetylmuramoyl-L-alanine amidase